MNGYMCIKSMDLGQESHYNDVIMSATTSQITSLTIVHSTVYSGADQRKHQSSASLVFVQGIHRGPVNSPHKGPVTRKMFPFHDVIMTNGNRTLLGHVDLIPLKNKSCYGVNFVITSVTGGCRYDNPRCRQWRQSWHHEKSNLYCNPCPYYQP